MSVTQNKEVKKSPSYTSERDSEWECFYSKTFMNGEEKRLFGLYTILNAIKMLSSNFLGRFYVFFMGVFFSLRSYTLSTLPEKKSFKLLSYFISLVSSAIKIVKT